MDIKRDRYLNRLMAMRLDVFQNGLENGDFGTD